MLEAVEQARTRLGLDAWAWPLAAPNSLLYAGALTQLAAPVVRSRPPPGVAILNQPLRETAMETR